MTVRSTELIATQAIAPTAAPGQLLGIVPADRTAIVKQWAIVNTAGLAVLVTIGRDTTASPIIQVSVPGNGHIQLAGFWVFKEGKQWRATAALAGTFVSAYGALLLGDFV